MKESIINFFQSGDIWAIVVKVLVTALISALVGLVGTLIGRIISKNKNSKIYKYAKTCVEAAEQKFPNEGTKMGPEKMAYVMDQLAIKFPKIKENSYLYNIAEAAVYELNKENKREAAIKEFEEKYGEKPLAALEDDKESTGTTEEKSEADEELSTEEKSSANNITKEKFKTSTKEKSKPKTSSQTSEVANSTSDDSTKDSTKIYKLQSF